MRAKATSLLSMVVVIACFIPCHAQSKDKQSAMTLDEVKAQIAEATANNGRVILKLKSGRTVSGFVVPLIDGAGFELLHYKFWSGLSKRDLLLYSDVASVKGRNPFVKVIKGVAYKSTAVGMIPVCLAALIARIPLSRCVD